MKASLYAFSGLPGTGKTVLAQRLASRIKAAHLRIDTMEQALRDLCGIVVEGEGYRLAYRIAADNLRLGVSVVADSCNPIELTRGEWEMLARDTQTRCVNIEVICSDEREHRRRIETRRPTVVGLVLPTWEAVLRREYHAWTRERIVIDTARTTENVLMNFSRSLIAWWPFHEPCVQVVENQSPGISGVHGPNARPKLEVAANQARGLC